MKHFSFQMNRRTAGGLAALAAVVLQIAPVSAAEASTRLHGCTVTPKPPVFAGFDTSGTKLIRFTVNVNCDQGRTVVIQQRFFEEDSNSWCCTDDDDLEGTATKTAAFPPSTGTIALATVMRLPNTESGNEEMFQRVRFQVSSNGVTSPWSDTRSPWQGERTAYTSFPN